MFSWSDGYVFTSPVGHFKANAWGLYDMHGNVWEWCGDWYSYGSYTHVNLQDPKGPAFGSDRALRGGSWYSYPRYCRSAYRNGHKPGRRGNYIGFRVIVPFVGVD